MENSEGKKIFTRVALVIFLIFLLNFVGSRFYWYYSIWYFDIIMHILGGLWVGLAVIWIFSKSKVAFSIRNIALFFVGVLIVGIFWEIFEILVNETIARNPFNFFDTISDIFCDLTGAGLALLFSKNIFRKDENKI
jgi:hypothetical protein